MEFRRLLNSLIRKAWIMVLLASIGGCTAYYLTGYKTIPMYKADCTLYVFNFDKVLQKGQTLNQNDLNFSLALVQNFSELIKSRKVTSLAAQDLKKKGLDINEDFLYSMISLGTQKQSNIIVISAVAKDPYLAISASNAMSQAFVTTLNELTSTKTIDILDVAEQASLIPKNYQQKVIIGFLLGLALGFAIIYIIELFDKTIRSVEDIESVSGIKVIGLIPEHKMK